MAPPELGSPTGDTQSECNQIKFIAGQIRETTLQIKKRNDEVIKTIDRSYTSKYGWKGSPIDVPGSSASSSRPRTSLDLSKDAERILSESTQMKRKLQDAIKVSAEQLRKEEDALRYENLPQNQWVTPTPYNGTTCTLSQSSRTPKPSGLVTTLRNVARKLGFRTSGSSKPNSYDRRWLTEWNPSETQTVFRPHQHPKNQRPSSSYNPDHSTGTDFEIIGDTQIQCEEFKIPEESDFSIQSQDDQHQNNFYTQGSIRSTETSSEFEYIEHPLLLHLAAVPDSDESFHQEKGSSVGSDSLPKQEKRRYRTPTPFPRNEFSLFSSLECSEEEESEKHVDLRIFTANQLNADVIRCHHPTPMSALRPEVPVDRIQIEVMPWVTRNIKYQITGSVVQEEPDPEIIVTINEDLEKQISEHFSFLDESINDCTKTDDSNDSDYTAQTQLNQTDKPGCQGLVNKDLDSVWHFPLSIETNELFIELEKAKQNINLAKDPTRPCCPPPPPPPPAPPFPSPESVQKRRVSLPVIPLDGSRLQSSIFSALETIDLGDLQLDATFIQENFLTPMTPVKGKRQSISPEERLHPSTIERSCSLPLLSLQTRKAIEIGARKIKSRKSVIINAIENMDIQQLDAEDVQRLLQMIPKDDELAATLAKLGDDNLGSLPDGFEIIKDLMTIPKIKQKLEALNFLMSFDEELTGVLVRVNLLHEAAFSIRNSQKFRNLLKLILTVINAGIPKEEEHLKGFQIQSLTRLTKTKASKTKTSLLQYIAKTLQDKMPEALKFYEDFANIDEVCKIAFSEIGKALTHLGREIQQIKVTMSQNCNLESDKVKSDETIDNDIKKHEEVANRWKDTIDELKSLSDMFGLPNVEGEQILQLFPTLRDFILEFKNAVTDNEKLQKIEANNGFETSKPKFSRLQDDANVPSCSKDTARSQNRRLSFPNWKTSVIPDNFPDQPEEFLNAIANSAAPCVRRRRKGGSNSNATNRSRWSVACSRELQ